VRLRTLLAPKAGEKGGVDLGEAPMAGEQRRERPRVTYAAWVEFTHDGRRLRARARDLSSGGIGLQLREPPPGLSDAVVSEFALPGIALPVEVRGVVAWNDVEQARCGVRFREMDAGIAELIESFVAGRL
jgi:c-di-GMP-binding flagellar brake protein YcgR